MIEIVTNSEAFLIVFSGVLIFTVQKLISDLWIAPNIEFQKCMGKIDTLLIRYEFLCGYEYGSNGGANDDDVNFFRKEIRDAVMDLVGKFRALLFIERLWLEWRGVNINQAKPQLLRLSQIISTKKDVEKVVPDAKVKIEEIRKNLKFRPFEINYEKLVQK